LFDRSKGLAAKGHRARKKNVPGFGSSAEIVDKMAENGRRLTGLEDFFGGGLRRVLPTEALTSARQIRKMPPSCILSLAFPGLSGP
jgi:hypothetical protein